MSQKSSLTGVSRETPQGGGGFIFASLKLNQEKTPNLESSFHRLWVKFAAETKSQRKTRENPQGVGVLFSLAFSKIPEKNPHPPGGFLEKTLYCFTAVFTPGRVGKGNCHLTEHVFSSDSRRVQLCLQHTQALINTYRGFSRNPTGGWGVYFC